MFSINAEDIDKPSKTPNLFFNFSVSVVKWEELELKDLGFVINDGNNIYESKFSDFSCERISVCYSDDYSRMTEFYQKYLNKPDESKNRFLEYFYETRGYERKYFEMRIMNPETYVHGFVHFSEINKYICSIKVDKRVTTQFEYQVKIDGIVGKSGHFTSNVLGFDSDLNMAVVSEMEISNSHEALMRKLKNENVDVITFVNGFGKNFNDFENFKGLYLLISLSKVIQSVPMILIQNSYHHYEYNELSNKLI